MINPNDPLQINAGNFLSTSSADASFLNKPAKEPTVIPSPTVDKKEEEDDIEDPNDQSYATFGIKLDDSINPFKTINPIEWLDNPDTRKDQIDKSISTMRDGLMKEGAKVPSIVDGKIEMVNANSAGRLTPAGMHAFDSAMQILSFAETDPQGGYVENRMTKEKVPAFGSKLMTPYDPQKSIEEKNKGVKDVEIGANSYKVKSITPDEVTSDEHIKTIVDSIKTTTGKDVLKDNAFNANELVNWRNNLANGAVALSPNTANAITQVMDTKDVKFDEAKIKQIDSTLARLKAEANMPEGKLVDLYNGQPIFNYKEIDDLNEFEQQFSKLNLPKADKARFLASFRTNFESAAGDLMDQAAQGGKAWDYLINFAPPVAIANALGADIGFNSEDQFLKAMEEGRSFYDMAKSGVIDVDRNGFQRFLEKTAMSTLTSFQNTGTGAGFLISKGLGSIAGTVSEDLEKAFDRGAGYMAEAAAVTQDAKRQYYQNIGSNENIMGTGISSDDLYDLTGNILETISTGFGSSFIKVGAKGAAKATTIAGAREIGKTTAKKVATEAAEAGVKRSALRNQLSSIKEQAKSVWLNSSAVNKAESVLTTSMHGSFTSAGGAVADGITKGLEKAAANNLSGEAAMEYASNEATGYALVNGVATFAVMTAMNSIAPGIEKILVSPQGGLSLASAIKNSVANKANRKALSALIKDVITDPATRKTIVKGVANEIGGFVNQNGVGKFMGGITAGTVSEFIEEAGDTALSLAGEAYLLQDKDTRKLLEQGGYWTEVLKAGVLGALGGSGAGLIQRTSKDNKKAIEIATKAMDEYKQTLPQQLKDKMGQMVQIQDQKGGELGRVDVLKNILNTGTVEEKINALTNIGKNVVQEIDPNAPAATSTPSQQAAATPNAPTTPSVTPNQGENANVEQGGVSAPPLFTAGNFPIIAGIQTSAEAVQNEDGTWGYETTGVNLILGEEKPVANKTKKTLQYATKEEAQKEAEESLKRSIDFTISEAKRLKENFADRNKEGDQEKIAQIDAQLEYFKVLEQAPTSQPNAGKPALSTETPSVESTSEPKQVPVKQFTVSSNETTATVDINVPVESEEQLASYAYREAHGKDIDGGKLAISEQQNIGILVKGKPKIQKVTSYSIDGEPANLHSVTINGETYFGTKENIEKIITDNIPNSRVTQKSLDIIKDQNNFTLKERPIQKQTSQPSAQQQETGNAPKEEAKDKKPTEAKQETKQETKPETKPEAPKQETKDVKPEEQNQEVVSEYNVKGIELLSASKIKIIQLFENVFKKLGVNVIFYNDKTFGTHSELPEDRRKSRAFYLYNTNTIGINLSKVNTKRALLKSLKHEIFHAVEAKFKKTQKGAELAQAAMNEISNDQELAKWMKKEYSPKWDSLPPRSKLAETIRAFVAGEINRETLGQPAFQKYIKAFLEFARKFTRSNPELEKYRKELDAQWKSIVDENFKAFSKKGTVTEAFLEFLSKFTGREKRASKRERRNNPAIFAKNATEEEISEIVKDIDLNVEQFVIANRDATPGDILNVIRSSIADVYLGSNTGLSKESQRKVFDEIISDWSKNENNSEILETIKKYRESLNTNDSVVLFEDIDEDTEVGQSVLEKSPLRGWTNVSKFIRSVNVKDDNNVAPVTDRLPINDNERLLFTNAFINVVQDENGEMPDLGLSAFDVVQVIDGSGNVESIMVFSHIEEQVDKYGNKINVYRFMKGDAFVNGKPTPFMRMRQATFEREFYEQIQSSGFEMSFNSNTGATIDDPKALIKTIFNSLLGGKDRIQAGDLDLGFDDMFNFISDPSAKSASPFFFTEGKINVNLAKLESNFAFITKEMLEGDRGKTTALLVAASVRSAIEEEMLHFATLSTFLPEELNEFANDLINNENFSQIVDQIKYMQGIENENDKLTDKEKSLIAVETLSFLHQKASEGAVYGDHYTELMQRSMNGNSVLVASQFAKRLKYMLGARAISSYMTPKMQEMASRLSLAKKELGFNRNQTNLYDIADKFTEEQYLASRNKLQSIINEAFIGNATEVAELRDTLRETNIPLKNILLFNWEDGLVELNEDFREFYKNRNGEQTLADLDEYFSQLNESNVLTQFSQTVRNAKERMDNYRNTLDTSRESDQAVVLAAEGNMRGLLSLIEEKKNQKGWIDPSVLLQMLNNYTPQRPEHIFSSEQKKLLEQYENFKNLSLSGVTGYQAIGTLYSAMVDNGLIDPSSMPLIDMPRVRQAVAGTIRVRETMRKLMNSDPKKKGMTQEQRDRELAKAEEDYIDKVHSESINDATWASMAKAVQDVINEMEVEEQSMLRSSRLNKDVKDIKQRLSEKLGSINPAELQKKAEAIADRIKNRRVSGIDFEEAMQDRIKQLVAKQQNVADNISRIIEEYNARIKAIDLLGKMPASTEATSVDYKRFAEATNNYNELVVDYAEILLNRNLNKVDEFGRSFTKLTSLYKNPFTFEENLFGYENQSPEKAIETRDAKRKVESELVNTPEKIEEQIEWQQGFRGRSTSKDREDNPLKLTTIEGNAAFLGEEEYNNMLLTKLKGANIEMDGLEYSFDDFYKTMGFLTQAGSRLKDGDDVVYSSLKDNLFKYKLPNDLKVITGYDANDKPIEKPIRFAYKTLLDKFTKGNVTLRQLANQITAPLVEDGTLMEWFENLNSLIGFDMSAGNIDPNTSLGVVKSINGKESFAFKFAKQLLYRMYNNSPVVTRNGEQRTAKALDEEPLNRDYSLFDNIKDLQDLLMYSDPTKYSNRPEYKEITNEKATDILLRLPSIFESIDAINHDIGLARKSFSRFRSEHVRNTIYADIRLIQEQNTDGIRANKELSEQIKKSFYDIQALDDIEWQIKYHSKGGVVGVKGFNALDLMSRFAAIPSSASKEYFVSSEGVVQKVESRVDENDPDFLEDRPAKMGPFDETVSMMAQGVEQTQEQIDSARRKEQNEELKKIKSWATHAGIAVFQTFSSPKDIHSHSLDVEKTRRFFQLFSKAIAESETAIVLMENDRQSEIGKLNRYRNAVNAMMAEQVSLWSNKYGDEGFADVLANISKYKHPMEFLLDVVNVIAQKERDYVSRQQRRSNTIAGSVLSGLRENVKDSVNKIENFDDQMSQYSELADDADTLRRKIKSNNKDISEYKKDADKESNPELAKVFLDSMRIKMDENAALQAKLNRVLTLMNNSTITESNNEKSSKQILDSLQEDVDNGKVTPGTLFYARTYDFGSANTKLDNSLFIKSPLFSLLIQAIPNLIIYQPNESYTGKKNFVQSGVEFATLPNGEHVLYIGNSEGLGSSRQSQVLQQLIISLINKELEPKRDANKTVNINDSRLASRIIDVARNVRLHTRQAFEHTPERIDAMVAKALEGLSKTSIDPKQYKGIIAKYRQSLEINAANQFDILNYRDSRNQYVDSITDKENPELRQIFELLLAPDLNDGTTSLMSDIALVTDILSNPDAYRLLNSVSPSDSSLVSFSIPPLRKEAAERAIKVFSSPEVRSQAITEIELSRMNQYTDEFNSDEPSVVNENDLLDLVYGSSIEDFYKAFEQTFYTGKAKDSKEARRFAKMADSVDNMPPDKIKVAIDAMLLVQRMNEEKAAGNEFSYDDVSQAKGAMAAFYDSPDHVYRYMISEMLGVFESLSAFGSDIQSISIFSDNYPIAGVAPESTASYLESQQNQTQFVKTLNARIMPEGNLTNYYYGKAPTTETFSRRRFEVFFDSILSTTPYGKDVLQRTFNSADTNKSYTKNNVDAAATPEAMSMISQLYNQIEELIGVDLMNEASSDINALDATRNANIESAENAIRDIVERIAKLQETGKEEVLKYILEQNKSLHKKTAASLISTAEAITLDILDLDNNRKSYYHSINKAIGGRGDLVKYRRTLTKILNVDTKIQTLFENKDLLANDEESYNQILRSLLEQRNALAGTANAALGQYSVSLTNAITRAVDKNYDLFEVNPKLAELIEGKFTPMLISQINYSYVASDTIADYIQEINGTYIGRGLLTKRLRRSYLDSSVNVTKKDYVNNLVDEYIGNEAIRSSIENQISQLKNELGEESPVVLAYTRLKNDKKSGIVRNLAESVKGHSDPEFIKRRVIEYLVRNESLLTELRDEVVFADLAAAFDSGTEVDAESVMDNQNLSSIGIQLVTREIEKLQDDLVGLQRSLASYQSGSDIVSNKLFSLNKEFRFDEATTRRRLQNEQSPTHTVNVEFFIDEERKAQDPAYAINFNKVAKSISVINAAMRMFVEREGEKMYRHLNEEVEVFANAFDVKNNIDNILDVARLRSKLEGDIKILADANFDALLNDSDGKAIQLYGVSIRDMEAMRYEPAIVETTKEGESVVKLRNAPKYESLKDRLKGLALFINDAHSKSIFLPTTEKEVESNTDKILYSRDAKFELAKLKRREGGSWSIDARLKDIVFNAALNPPVGLAMRTVDKKISNVNLDDNISDGLAKAAKISTPTTIRSFMQKVKEVHLDYFLNQAINRERSLFAKGVGVVSALKEFKRMRDNEINELFDSVYAFASNPNNASVLQNSGMELLKKNKKDYSADEVRSIVEKAHGIIISENQFLDSRSPQSHSIMLNDAQIDDVMTMLHSPILEKNRKKYESVMTRAEESMSSIYNIAQAMSEPGFSFSKAVLKADVSHNYASLFSAINGRGVLEKLIAGAFNATKTDNWLYDMSYHQNALLRGKFRGNHGAYLEALSLVGIMDHGVNGFSGKNRYTSEYQDFQNRMGIASEKLNNNFMNGAKAYLIASLKGIADAERRDTNSSEPSGHKAWLWATSFINGVEDHRKLIRDKSKLKTESNFAIKAINKIYNKTYKQDKESAAIFEIYELIKREVQTMASATSGPIAQKTTKSGESYQEVLINQMIKKLEQGLSDSELNAVNEYSNALLKEFSDITDAHRIANVFASKDLRTETGAKEKLLGSDDFISNVYNTSYSTVPLKFGYTRNPLDTVSTGVDRSSIDIDEFISFERSSLNYKNIRYSRNNKPEDVRVYRPLDINPFTAPDSLANDALYRTHVAPTYNILRKLLGRIVRKSNGEMITEGGMLMEIGTNEVFLNGQQNYEYISAYVLNTIEKQIRNDMPQELMDNSFNNAIKFSTVLVLAKQLISVWQPILNGVIPAASKGFNLIAGKLFHYSDKDISRYAEALWLALKSRNKPDSEMAKFVKENSITSYKHRAEGANIRSTQIAIARYHKENRAKYGLRYLMSKFSKTSEGLLDLVIGGPERIMVQAIYTFELHNRLKKEMTNPPATIEEMLKLNPDEISTLAKTRADIMVTDFMGLGDKSKKAGVYNLDKTSPLASLIFNGFVRHGNHSATVNANRAMYAEIFASRIFGKTKTLDRETINEGIENIAGTMIQNSLFFVFRAAAATQFAAYVASLMAEMFDEEDEEEVTERAARYVESITTWNDESSWMWNILKEQLFPSFMMVSDPNFNEEGYNDAYVNLIKDVSADVAWDAVGITPGGFGSAFSFGPTQAAIKTSAKTLSTAAFGNAEDDWYEMKDAVRDSERINPILSNFQEPYSTGINMLALLQNRFTPKDGFDGIDNKELIYGLTNQILGTREARARTPKRHAEQGGWGYKPLKDDGFKVYWELGEEE